MSDPNPFAGLLGVSEVKSSNNQETDENSELLNINQSQEDEKIKTISSIVEDVFHFTINPNAVQGEADRQLVYLEELAQAMNPRIYIDLEALEQALFERLLLQDIEQSVIPKFNTSFKDHVIQKKVFPYLFSSMENIQSYNLSDKPYIKNALDKMMELIFRNAVTALKQPALFEGQDFSLQLVAILQHVGPQSHTFFNDLIKAFVSDGNLLLHIYSVVVIL